MALQTPQYVQEDLQAYVYRADLDSIEVGVIDGTIEHLLSGADFKLIDPLPHGSVDRAVRRYKISTASDFEKAKSLIWLRNLGVPFVSEIHGWPPSAVFELLRDRGLVSGSFKEIYFNGSGKITIVWNHEKKL